MGVVRVVLYAEGPRETSGVAPGRAPAGLASSPRAYLDPFAEEELGPGHVLVRRALYAAKRIPAMAVRFVEGLRYKGRRPRGSQLLHRTVLRQILTPLRAEERPSVFVILVDRDGDAKREQDLLGHVDGLESAPRVIVVAREEFEAWLIADDAAVSAALGTTVSRPPDPETLAPGEAKRQLDGWVNRLADRARQPEVRRAIAEGCSLDVVATRCPAFQRFLDALSRVHLDA